MKSVHDNLLLGYSVSARERRIVFDTEYPHATPPEETVVQFEGVQAYYFQHDLMGTILFGIEEVSPEMIERQYEAQFQAGWRYGWPLDWHHATESISLYTKRHGIRCFEVSSSYGLDGWIMCKEMNTK